MNSADQDITLWESFRKGDKEAFSSLFRQHYESLVRYGCKFTNNTSVLEDAIQELFIELWQSRSSTPVASVRAYLLKSLKYKLLKAYRQTRTTVPMTDTDGPFEWSHESFLIAGEEDADKKRRLLKALSALTARQKEIVYLKYYQNLSYDEVSEIMNINYQAARNLLYQAIRSLKTLLPGPMQIIFLFSVMSTLHFALL